MSNRLNSFASSNGRFPANNNSKPTIQTTLSQRSFQVPAGNNIYYSFKNSDFEIASTMKPDSYASQESEGFKTLSSIEFAYKKVKTNSNVPDHRSSQNNYDTTPPKIVPSRMSSGLPTNATTPVPSSHFQNAKQSQNLQPTEVKSRISNAAKAKKSEDKDDEVYIDIEKAEGKVLDYNDFEDSTPDWAKKEYARDASGKRPNQPGYDPTTLMIPSNALDRVTPTMRQYWQIKSQNYDKIVLFKLGKFYELFYDDAVICQKELDLNWMGNKMHVGFPEKTLDKYAYMLVNKGYKVCVVEQTETPKQMEERLKTQKYGKREKIVNRETVQIMSKGTCVDPNDVNFEAKILLSVRYRKSLIAVTFLEIGSNVLTMGAFQDDDNFTLFKTFISQIRPVEVIYETLETPPNLMKIIKNCPTSPVMSPINDMTAWNHILAYAELEKYYGPTSNWPEGLQEVAGMVDFIKDQIMVTFAGMITYLTKMLIIENVMCTARYEIYDPSQTRLTRMMIDSQALQHLEVLEVEYSTRNSFEGSLLSYIDKTVSPFGKRLLKKWICAPLLSLEAINDRLDAIEDLEYFHEERDQFRRGLKVLPDLERLCAKIYNQSVRKNEAVVMFEEVSVGKLREFKRLLDNLKKARDLYTDFASADFKSNLMRNLMTSVDGRVVMEQTANNVPEILPLLKEMGEFVRWEGPKQDIPVPKPGVDREYDACKKQIDRIEAEFTEYLQSIQARFGGNRDICYAHTKHRYEIEIPSKLVEGNKKPKDFEFSSKKQDRERFITRQVKDLVEKLEEVEERLKQTLNVFVCFLFSYFHRHYPVWDKFIEALAQLDCLCSLSLTSFLSDGVMCRPQLFPMDERVFMDVRDLRHPCLSLAKPNFVPNDILIGDVNDDGNYQNVLLLTGPNMGGKSTILRQACIVAILAQIGCYIPATSCQLSLVDRIFTRIGASDKLMEGKSTFYIEMEETVNVVKYGSMNSLAIMDELGRGTSTFDGVAIAYAVMRYIMKKLGCRTFFATHYHVLLDEFRDEPQMRFVHMGSKIDYQSSKIIFLYKLSDGECSNSFGLNIARMSGLDKTLVAHAKKKAVEFEENFNIREAVRANKKFMKLMKALITRKNNEEESFDFIKAIIEGGEIQE